MDNSNGLLQIGAGLGYMRPSPLLRSERKRKQITLAANLQTHKDKLVKTLPTDVKVPLAKRRKQGDEGVSVSVSSPLSSPPISRSPSPLTISPHTKEKATAKGPLVKKKEIQPLDLNLQRWQKINKYVAASQQSTLLLTQFMIVEEDVAKHLLAEDASASVEFLTIQLAIAVGAHLDGDNQAFQESWTKARNQLSGLFDKSDYAVARALFLMGGVSIFLRGEEEQGSYYLLLSQMMCESLAMVNSDVYLRLLCYSALFDLRKGNLDKTIQHIHKLRDALELPYCSDPSFLGLKGNESFHFPRRSSVGLLAQNAKNAAAYARIPYLLADMLQGVASCLYCWKAGEQRDLIAARLLKCMSNIMKELVDGEAATSTPGESSNPPSVNHCVGPSSYALDLRLIVTSLTADTLWQIGCTDLALQWAISFLYFSKTNAFAKLLSPAVLLSRSVLTIFFETGNFLLLQAQLEVLKPLQALYVPLRGIVQSFEQGMKAAASTVSLGLLPTDVLNEHMCHMYTTNTNPRATTITTTTSTKKTNPPSPKAATTSAASVNVSCVPQPSGMLGSTNIGPAEIPPEAGDILAALVGDDDTPVSDSWITNLGAIEDLQCEDLLKDFGFDD